MGLRGTTGVSRGYDGDPWLHWVPTYSGRYEGPTNRTCPEEPRSPESRSIRAPLSTCTLYRRHTATSVSRTKGKYNSLTGTQEDGGGLRVTYDTTIHFEKLGHGTGGRETVDGRGGYRSGSEDDDTCPGRGGPDTPSVSDRRDSTRIEGSESGLDHGTSP